MKNWLKNNCKVLLLSTVLLVVSFFVNDFESNYKYIFFYMFIFCVIDLLPRNKFTEIAVGIIRFPVYLTIIFRPIVKGGLFIMFAFMLPLVIFQTLITYGANIWNIELSQSTLTYLTLMISSIFIIEFYEKLLDLIIKFFHLHKDDDKRNFISSFSTSLMNKQRIRFLIYSFYFIYLIPYSIIRLQSNSNHELMNSIFYSFSTFLAYEKIAQNLNLMKIDYRRTIKVLLENSIFFGTKLPQKE